MEEQKRIVEEDKLNRQSTWDPKIQILPADLFVSVGFKEGRPIYERNPRWHDDKGYFIGRPKK